MLYVDKVCHSRKVDTGSFFYQSKTLHSMINRIKHTSNCAVLASKIMWNDEINEPRKKEKKCSKNDEKRREK